MAETETVIRLIGSACEVGAALLVGRDIVRARRALGEQLPWDPLVRWTRQLFRRKTTPVSQTLDIHLSAHGHSSATGALTVEKVWDKMPDSERVEWLREELSRLQDLNQQAHAAMQERMTGLDERLASETTELRTSHHDLHRTLQEEKRVSLRVDWRALPLIIVGVLLTTWSAEIASWL